MNKNMRKVNKVVLPAILAVLVVSGFAGPALVSVAEAATFNGSTAAYSNTLEAFNYSENGSCSSCWQTGTVDADLGDVVTFEIFYQNTSNETAQNTIAKLSVTGLGDGEARITATVDADNASAVSGSVNVRVPSGKIINSLTPEGTIYWTDRNNNHLSLGGQDADDLLGGGLDLGDTIPGFSNMRFVVVRLEVNGNDAPQGGDEPDVTTISATNITDDSAKLRGEVDPNGLDTEVWFEWGEGFFALDNDTPKQDVGDGSSVIDFDRTITGLEEDEVYYFRAVARNSEGTERGQTLQFRTDENGGGGDGPEIIEIDVENIDDDSARLICEVDPNGEDTKVWFEWSDDEDEVEDGDGEETDDVNVDGDESSEEVKITISGLDEDTEYFFQCFADNDDGDDESDIDNFTTDENGGGSGDEPEVTTLAATDVTTNSALLRGEVDPNGEDTSVWFEWGTSSTNLNRDTADEDAGDGTNEVDFDNRITGLSANTTYYFRAIAESDEGTDRGVVRSFRTNTTQPPTIITQIVERVVEREPEPEPEGLIITLDVDTTEIDSDEIRYTVSYENRTDETFTNAELIVHVPAELDFVDADPSEDDEDGNDLFFTIGTITPGEEDSFVIDTEVSSGVDENDEIFFSADVEYTDSGTRKIVTVENTMTLREARFRGGFGAFFGGVLGDFFTNPLLWLIILLAVIFFVYRYFANLAAPKQEPIYIREPFQAPKDSA